MRSEARHFNLLIKFVKKNLETIELTAGQQKLAHLIFQFSESIWGQRMVLNVIYTLEQPTLFQWPPQLSFANKLVF